MKQEIIWQDSSKSRPKFGDTIWALDFDNDVSCTENYSEFSGDFWDDHPFWALVNEKDLPKRDPIAEALAEILPGDWRKGKSTLADAFIHGETGVEIVLYDHDRAAVAAIPNSGLNKLEGSCSTEHQGEVVKLSIMCLALRRLLDAAKRGAELTQYANGQAGVDNE